MPPRLLAFDLDGTLLDSRSQLPDRNRLALAEAAESGIAVMLVSGRHHRAVAPVAERLGLPTPAICCNGAYVYDFARARLELPGPLAPEAAGTAVRLCRAQALYFLLYTEDGLCFDLRTPGQTPADMRRLFPAAAATMTEVEDVGVLAARETVYKLVIAHEAPERLKELQQQLDGLGGYASEFSWVNRLDVTAAGNSKGGKLVEWAAARGIPAADIVAFGDQENDLSMLRAVGRGIAMGNAAPEVKAVASETIGDHDGPALADTVRAIVAAAGR